MNIKILFEDQDIVIINKPSGIAVHSDGRSEEKTISDWFIEKYPKSKDVGESIQLRINNEELPPTGDPLDNEPPELT